MPASPKADFHDALTTFESGFGKLAKDLAQAATLVSWFAAHEPQALGEARADAMERGPSWRKSLKAGWARLQREFPDAVRAFEDASR